MKKEHLFTIKFSFVFLVAGLIAHSFGVKYAWIIILISYTAICYSFKEIYKNMPAMLKTSLFTLIFVAFTSILRLIDDENVQFILSILMGIFCIIAIIYQLKQISKMNRGENNASDDSINRQK